MANEIEVAYSITGRTGLYAVVRNSIGQVWQTTTSTFVAYVSANLANYTIAMTEQGTSTSYVGNMPVVPAGVYGVSVFDQQGGGAAESDPLAGVGNIAWDGSAVMIPLATTSYTAPHNSNIDAIFDKLPVNNIADETLVMTAIENLGGVAVSAISRPEIPAFLVIPPTGTFAYVADFYLTTLGGVPEDPDGNVVTVHVRNASGTSFDSKLASTTMGRVSAGRYRLTFTVGSTDEAQVLYFDFTWSFSLTAMQDGAVTNVVGFGSQIVSSMYLNMYGKPFG